jgi:dienelactone hydrolase
VEVPAPATRFVAAAKAGRAPAVVFVHDLAAGKDLAMVEASRLARQGVASLVLAGAYRPTRDGAEFAAYVDQVRGVIADLRKRADVDRNRIALLGEGTGARVAAVVLGKERGTLRGAVLADLGAAGGGGGKFAPERWLGRSPGSPVMLQRSADRDRTTDAQIKQLVLAAPPGTLVYEYKGLDAQAQAERDRWLRNALR